MDCMEWKNFIYLIGFTAMEPIEKGLFEEALKEQLSAIISVQAPIYSVTENVQPAVEHV